MSLHNSIDPQVKGINRTEVLVTADANDGTNNTIPAGAEVATVVGVVTDATDFIVLPRLKTVPNGFELKILCSAGANFEIRTPATSAEEINSEDCDGTKEYLATDTEIITAVKINDTIGWAMWSHTAVGAKSTAVVPD
jgi:hypothetical protein